MHQHFRAAVGLLPLPALAGARTGARRTAAAPDVVRLERGGFRDGCGTVPALVGFVSYQQYRGAALEALDTAVGNRRVVSRSRTPLQAPNRSPGSARLAFAGNAAVVR